MTEPPKSLDPAVVYPWALREMANILCGSLDAITREELNYQAADMMRKAAVEIERLNKEKAS